MSAKAKSKAVFVCTECGYETPRWMGKCPECMSWNSLEEDVRVAVGRASAVGTFEGATAVAQVDRLSEVSFEQAIRYKTGILELDRVLGGGIVPGSAVLICGDPGIGKSTLLLQMCGAIEGELFILYICGEESKRQVKMRADRLNIKGSDIAMTECTNTEMLYDLIQRTKPRAVVVDSVQTLTLSTLSSSAGSVTQVRESTQLLINACKPYGIPLFIVGHVTKDGGIAGPKVLEHMVDTVLYFEGDRNLSYRILRSIKNRFGSTNEIGVFEMLEYGLSEVNNPSEALLLGRPTDVSGTCITCLMEGTRPILIEVQGLVSKAGFGNPRRSGTGFDIQRLGMLIAVIEKRSGFFMGNFDIFVNVTGGLRIDEPAADLAVCLALISNLTDKPINSEIIAFGEIGLTGEVRSATQLNVRMSEAYRLGFRQFIIPKVAGTSVEDSSFKGAKIYRISRLSDAISII